MKERILILTKGKPSPSLFSIKAFRFVFNLSLWKLFWPTLSEVCVRAEWPVRPVRLARIFKKLNPENWSFWPSNLTYQLLLTHRLYIWLWFFPFWHNQGRIQKCLKGGGTKLWLTTDKHFWANYFFSQLRHSPQQANLLSNNRRSCRSKDFSVKQVVKKNRLGKGIRTPADPPPGFLTDNVNICISWS